MPRFKRVYVEITNNCNLNCDFCPSSKLKRNGKMMTEEAFQEIINQLKPYTNYLYFHLLGEPLLNPRLEKFFKISEEAGMFVNLTTNGTLINKAANTLINAKSLRQINFSIHSFESNESDKTIENYLEQIVNFINQIQKERTIYCNLRLWNMSSEELQAKNTLNQKILNIIEDLFGLDFKLSEQLQTKNNIKIRPGVFINMAEKFEWPNLDRQVISEEMFCYGLRDHLAIQVDGTVVPCCLDSEGQVPLGNIFEKPLEAILNDPRATAIYDGFSRRYAVEELCKRCGYATRYSQKK